MFRHHQVVVHRLPFAQRADQMQQTSFPRSRGPKKIGYECCTQFLDDQGPLVVLHSDGKPIKKAVQQLAHLGFFQGIPTVLLIRQQIPVPKQQRTHQLQLILTVKVSAPKNLTLGSSLASKTSAMFHPLSDLWSSCRHVSI